VAVAKKQDELTPHLKNYITAGYPCLFMRTVEPLIAEQRVRSALQELEMSDQTLGSWKVTTGLHMGRADGTVPEREVQGANDLIGCLKHIEGMTDPVVVILHNVRQFVNNYQVIQHLVDTIYSARLRGQHLILVGPHIELPPELKNLVQYVDCPLPNREQIEAEYEKIVRAYSDQIKLPKGKEERKALIRSAANAAVGLDQMAAENAIALSLATAETVDIRVIQRQKEQEVRKSDVLEFFPTDETMDDVGGFRALKDWIAKRRRVFTQEARDYGLPFPKGMLVVGPAGTGKSLVAKATAGYFELPLLRLDMGKVFRSLVGESESAMRLALQVAEACSPVVLWLDEIEKAMAGAAGSGELDSGVTARVVSTVLTWRQETRYPVVLIATANNVATLPSMVYRKGRLDEVWATDLPLLEEREEIFRIHLRKRKRDPEIFQVPLLAKTAEEFVGAEIEGCIEDAMFDAFSEGKEVTPAYIIKAMKATIPQAQRDVEELRAIREWVRTRARSVSGGEAPTLTGSKVRQIHTTKKGGKR